MMEEGLSDPLDISNEPKLIKEAQADISKLDLLVCGECHQVFHFVEELQEHKTVKCSHESDVKTICENEIKPQVWGFTLWKNMQLKNENDQKTLPSSSSWVVYQRWCKLDQTEKDLWITAGENLQGFNKIATAKLQELKVVKQEEKVEKDPLAVDEPVPVISSKEQQIVTVHLDEEVADLIKKGMIKPIKISTIQNPGTAMKTNKENDKEEFTVEKIMAKRYNPKRKTWEYEIKWENYEEETWEPLAHLGNCKEMIDEFEERIKTEKEKILTPAPRGRGRPRLSQTSTPGKTLQTPVKKSTPTQSVILSTPDGGRPQRTSKQKALNQVKQWCGNISDSDEMNNKRPYEDDDDSDDSFEKKMKLDADSEDTDYEEPSTPIKKIPKIINTYNNGSMKKLPSNVLIPDAKGVVRISHKQLPSLSSGVYIMSKTSGIIKLDPAASKLATSGGQTILKVTPKVGQRIGQAQIKLIKRSSDVDGKTGKILKPIIKQIKKSDDVITKTPQQQQQTITTTCTASSSTPKLILNESISSKFPIMNDDSDDGIEELEFPTDLPVPQPDSPPGEFVLDPITGKIAGEVYPEKTAMEQEVDEMAIEQSGETTVDNIVKLAAADITEDDLKNDNETAVVLAATTTTTTTTNSLQQVITTEKEPKIYTVSASEIKKNPSILNTAIANSNILQKTLLNPSVSLRKKIQPKVINQTVASRPSITVTPVIRSINTNTTNLVKQRTTTSSAVSGLPKPKISISPMKSNSNHDHRFVNKVTRKVGETVIYKKTITQPSPLKQNNTSTTTAATTTTRTITPLKKELPKILNSGALVSSAVKPVINMPSLTMDDEPLVTSQQQQQQQVITAQNVDENIASETTELPTFSLSDNERPMFITGDDGTVYQVAGQNEEGQTILVTQDSNGQQQCLLVTNETVQEETQQEEQMETEGQEQETGDVNEEQPVVAQFIRTEPPSPGGTHKVVVMLPDGDVMVTQVTPEEYASLALDK